MVALVIPELKLAYIHIPKTAGTSISSWMRKQLTKKNIEFINYGHIHQSLKDLAVPNDYTIISSIRNPWDRMVSVYHYAKKIKENNPKISMLLRTDQPEEQIPEFNQWILNIQNYELNVGAEKHFNSPMDDGHWPKEKFWWNLITPQSAWLHREPDILIKFETLHNDSRQLNDIFSSSEDISHTNISDHKNYKTYYTPESIDIISKYYSADLKRWDYKY